MELFEAALYHGLGASMPGNKVNFPPIQVLDPRLERLKLP